MNDEPKVEGALPPGAPSRHEANTRPERRRARRSNRGKEPKKLIAPDGRTVPTPSLAEAAKGIEPTKFGIFGTGKNDVQNLDELNEVWTKRAETAHEILNDPVMESKFLSVMEDFSLGVRYAVALNKVGLDWPGFNHAFLSTRTGALRKIHHAATSLCRLNRKLLLEEEAYRRAVEGVDEPVYTNSGRLAGTKKKHSDAILLRMLESHDPERYGTKQTGLAGSGVILNISLGGITRNPPVEKVIDVEATTVDTPVRS